MNFYNPPLQFFRFRVYRDEVATYPLSKSRILMGSVEICPLKEENISEMLSLPDREHDKGVLERRFARGDYCLGIRLKGRLIGLIWAVFRLMDYGKYKLQLQPDEAYVIDAYVDPAFRGKGLGPYLYTQLMKVLKERGCRYVYSITEVDNKTASPLRGRIHSELVDSGFVLKFFGRWRIGTRARPEKLRDD